MSIISKVWITGAEGRLGSELNRMLNQREFELLDTDCDDVDVTNVEDVLGFADRNHPDRIIHCAGMTDTAACEQDPERAFRVNALGARNVAIAARKIGARLIHLSTDDVFGNGADQPYTEFDIPCPITVYGRSKLAGENFVRELAPKHIVIRSGWVYGANEHSFVTWLLQQVPLGQPVAVADDQTGCPTSAKELARAVVRLMDTSEYGTYHAACEGSCTRLAFAKEILRLSGQDLLLVPAAHELSEHIFRPAYTALDNFMLRISGLYRMADWQSALREYLQEMPLERLPRGR